MSKSQIKFSKLTEDQTIQIIDLDDVPTLSKPLTKVNGFTRIRTPFLYPDGDIIDLFVQEQNGSVTITDLGETMRWLRTQSISPRRSPKQTKLVEDVCLNHGLEFFRGMLLARVKPGDNFAAVAMRAAQGALRVAKSFDSTVVDGELKIVLS